MKLAIAIPTYNEADNIKKLIPDIKKVLEPQTDVNCTLFVVDDNSPDGTAAIAENLGKKLNSKTFTIKVLKRAKKEGLGKAYIYAFQKILDQKFDFIMQMDADFSHHPKYIKDLIREARQGKDFVATSRYMKGGKIVGWGLHRRILSLGGNIYTRLFLDNKITDYTNGLNLFSSDLLRKVNMNLLDSAGYGFFIELKYTALQHAQNFSQIPIVLTDRVHGKSKLPRNTIFVNLILVPRLRYIVHKKIRASRAKIPSPEKS